MNEHVGIGMAQSAVGVRYFYAAKPEIEAFFKLVYVVAEAGSYFHNGVNPTPAP